MNGFRGLRMALVLTLSLTLGACVTTPEKSTPPPPQENLSSTAQKDIYTRAKLHTELAALYFQANNLIVALEELTIAISIDPGYALAYSTRGVVLYYIQEFDSARKDFRQALALDDKDPAINNNYGWFLCHTGKEKEGIDYLFRAIRNPLHRQWEGRIDALRAAPEEARAAYEAGVAAGDFSAAHATAGEAVGLFHDLPSAAVLIARMDTQARARLALR